MGRPPGAAPGRHAAGPPARRGGGRSARRLTEAPPRIGRECSRDTNASIAEHFERGTLENGLPDVRLPMLFVTGALDPVPLWSVERTASLVPGARFEAIPASGHFPWWETPGEIRRIVGEWLEAG